MFEKNNPTGNRKDIKYKLIMFGVVKSTAVHLKSAL